MATKEQPDSTSPSALPSATAQGIAGFLQVFCRVEGGWATVVLFCAVGIAGGYLSGDKDASRWLCGIGGGIAILVGLVRAGWAIYSHWRREPAQSDVSELRQLDGDQSADDETPHFRVFELPRPIIPEVLERPMLLSSGDRKVTSRIRTVSFDDIGDVSDGEIFETPTRLPVFLARIAAAQLKPNLLPSSAVPSVSVSVCQKGTEDVFEAVTFHFILCKKPHRMQAVVEMSTPAAKRAALLRRLTRQLAICGIEPVKSERDGHSEPNNSHLP